MRFVQRLVWFTLLALSVLVPGPFAAAQDQSPIGPLVLTVDGRPQVEIVIGDQPFPTERYAAEEFRDIVERISGARLPIVDYSHRQGGAAVVIGTPDSLPEIAALDLFTTDHPEEVRIVRRGDTLILAGPTPRGALYATYTFLQEVLGARWFWPGSSGEYLPRQATITVYELDIRQVPSIELRFVSLGSLGSASFDPDTSIWMARNRMNVHGAGDSESRFEFAKRLGFLTRTGGHNSGTLPPEVFLEHPEYMAEYSGMRQIPPGQTRPHLDWSNPGAQAALAKQIAETWEKYPGLDFVAFYGPDHQYYCDSPACLALAPDTSTRWQRFSKAVMAILEETHPGKKYHSIAYQGYRPVPTEAANWDMVGYTAYNLNYTKPITHPSNTQVRRELQGWMDLGVPMGLRGYHFVIFNEPIVVPQTSLIMQEIAWAAEIGLKAWWSEVAPYGWPPGTEATPEEQPWVANRMALYAAAQSLWNADLDPEQLMQDWATTIFGPAGDAMYRYYSLMDEAWRSSLGEITYFTNPVSGFVRHFMSREPLAQLDAELQEARKALGAVEDPDLRKRIEAQIRLEMAMLDKWRVAYRVQQGLTGRFELPVPLALERPRLTGDVHDPAWEDAARLPAFVDSRGEDVPGRTEVYAMWDREALYLRFINRLASDADGTIAAGENADLLNDAIELFLDDPVNPGASYRLTVTASGARSGARLDFALTAGPSWDQPWTAAVRSGESLWIADMALPFASFGINPAGAGSWQMSFKRSGGSATVSGWPDGSYRIPSGFGRLQFVEAVPERKKVVLFSPGNPDPARVDALRFDFQAVGFTLHHVQTEADLAAALAEGADVLILRHPSGAVIPDALISRHVKPWLIDGGLLFIAGTGQIPLARWFGSGAAVEWSGWDVHRNRRTSWSALGPWQEQPHPLSEVVLGRLTPASGYRVVGDDWEVLAKLRMADNSEVAYLMRQEVGDGTLVLISSSFGFSGGHEMFGNLNTANAAKLIDNLLFDHRRVWQLHDPLDAPLNTGWFGIVDRMLSSAESPGWAYVGDRNNLLFGDPSRKTRRANTEEWVVWDTERLKQFEVRLYARTVEVEPLVRLHASADGVTWQELSYQVIQENMADGWHLLKLRGAVPTGADYTAFRLTLLPGDINPADLQIGEVLLTGRN